MYVIVKMGSIMIAIFNCYLKLLFSINLRHGTNKSEFLFEFTCTIIVRCLMSVVNVAFKAGALNSLN